MHHALWIWVVITMSMLVVVESKPSKKKIKPKCPVSDLKLVCSSSNSVKFDWEVKANKWKGDCRDQIFNINYFQPGSNISLYIKPDIKQKEVLIPGLETNKKYEFKFVHYWKIENVLHQVEHGYFKREATPHEPEIVKNLRMVDLGPTWITVVWSTSSGEINCISSYIFEWCVTHYAGVECQSQTVPSSPEHHTLQDLTPCTTYTLTLTTVDIDNVSSSQTATQTFTTTSGASGSVKDLSIYRVSPESLSITWAGDPCTLYNVSIIGHHPIQLSSYIANSGTSYTFWYLQPCSLYEISVSALPHGELENNGTRSSKKLQAYTSIISTTTVSNLRVYDLSEHSMALSWEPPTPLLGCISGYKVEVISGYKVIQTRNTSLTSLVVDDLESCTSYTVHVIVVFSGETLSLQSSAISARTHAPATVISQHVQNVSVVKQTPDSLIVTWERPQFGVNCLHGYNITLYNLNNESYNMVHTQYVEQLDNTTCTFINLKQCEQYYIYITPVFGNEVLPFKKWHELTETFTTTTDEVVVTDLLLGADWSSLQLQWSIPLRYKACTRHYEVQMCAGKECKGPVTVTSPSYHLTGLLACTSYTAEVKAELSHTVATASGLTRGPEAVKSNQLQVVNETSDSITYIWEIPKEFRNCRGQFVVSMWDENGSVIKDKKLNYLAKEYTAKNLKACHTYFFTLTLLDSDANPTINYIVVNATTKASDDQKVQSLEARPKPAGMSLGWSVTPGSSACVSHYQVCVKDRNGSLTSYNSAASTFAWAGDLCSLDSVSVQMVSGRLLVGQPVSIQLRQQFEDLRKLTVRIANIGPRQAKVCLYLAGFMCVSDYMISWHRVTNLSTTVTVANLSISRETTPTQCARLSVLDPCTTYNVTVIPQDGLAKIGMLNTTLTTDYTEPVVAPRVAAVTRGFNVSWNLVKHDTRYCLSHVRVSVKNGSFHKQVKVYTDTHKVIGDLIPCQKYYVTVEGFGRNVPSPPGKTYYSKLEKVNPEVLPIPDTVALMNVTRHSTTLVWDVGSSDTNMCEPIDIKADCHPDAGLNMYITGWSPATIRLLRLSPYTRYDCSLVVLNEAGQSNKSHISFITLEGVPSQPKNVMSIARSSSEVLVTWHPPDQVPGVLTNYTVSVYNQTLKYPLSPLCVAPPLDPRQLVVGSNITQAVVGGLSPAVSLQVSVVAATASGSGPPSPSVTSGTLDGISDPVEDLNVTLGYRKVLLSWSSPCLTNGLLDHFLVKLNGTRPNHDTPSYTWNLTVDRILKSYSTDINITLLIAEAVYSATVIPIGLNDLPGQLNSKNFIVPSRIPARLSEEVFAMLPPVQPTSSTATVSIRSDLFPDTEGSIRYYAVIVAGNFSYGPDTGWLSNQSWPNMKNWAKAVMRHPTSVYQATQPWWNPFKGMDTTPFAIKQYTIGVEECSKADLSKFCNGPLLPGTHYAVRIRAFTHNGFRDSQSIPFQTVDPIEEAYPIILVLVVLAVVTTLAFTYLAVTRHRKWIKEKKRITKIKSRTEGEKKTPIRKHLPLVKFIDHMENIVTSESLLDEEYKDVMDLTKQIIGSTTIAHLPHNISRNRYGDIIPYDSTLVKLENGEENGYINASHIKIQGRKSRHYIACQGPKEGTCEDFWRMVIQYNVNPIVMLCMPCEEGKMKCFPYFPINSGEVEVFGEIRVYCTREEAFTNYIIRYLTVEKNGVIMQIQQFHFTQWKDKNLPEKPEYLVNFIEHIRKAFKQKHSTTAVHCSAGVGRTGTFIAVDELLRKIRQCWRCSLSVTDTVLQLREQRHHKMVQTKGQYQFIYECVKYALENHTAVFERGTVTTLHI